MKLEEEQAEQFIKLIIYGVIGTVICVLSIGLSLHGFLSVLEELQTNQEMIHFAVSLPFTSSLLFVPLSLLMNYQKYFRRDHFSQIKWNYIMFAVLLSPVVFAPATYFGADYVFEKDGYHRCTDHHLLHSKGSPWPDPIDTRVWVLDKAICKVP